MSNKGGQNQWDLSTSRERLLVALEATDLGIWDYNPLTGELLWDKRCRELFELPENINIDFELFVSMIHPSYRTMLRQKVNEVLQKKNDDRYNVRYKIAGYSGDIERWIKSTGKVFYNEKNEVIRLVGTIQDITDIIASKDQLEDIKSKYQQQSEVLLKINEIGKTISAELDPRKIVQLITDLATEITQAEFGAFFYNDINEEGERYMLFTHSGLGKEKFDTYPMPRNTRIFGPTFKGERIIRYDDVTKEEDFGKNAPYFGMPEGHPPVRSYLAVPVISKGGEVIGGLFFGHSQAGVFKKEAEQIVDGIAAQASIAIDNANLYEEAKKAHKAAEEQRSFMYKIFEDAPAIIIVTKGPTHSYEFINKKGRELFGNLLKPGVDHEILNKEGVENEIMKIADEVYHTGEPAILSEIPLTPDITGTDELRYFNAFYFPVKDKYNKTEGIIRYGLEVTEQVKSRKSIEDFMSIASHELKTPMTTIMSYLELMQEGINTGENKLPFYLDRLHKGVERLNNLVNDLLDVTRINKGRLNFDMDVFEAGAFFRACFENVLHLAKNRQIIISGEADQLIEADKGRLEQVFTNLFVNALKYSEDKIEINIFSDTDTVGVKIKDYGVGIPEGKMNLLFNQFSVIQNKKTTGLGIGLFIAKQIIDRHQGQIKVESTSGKGSEFTVILPVYEKGKH